MSVLNTDDCLEKHRISYLSWPVQLWRTRVISVHPGPTHRRLIELTPVGAAMESPRSPAHNECHVWCFLLSISTSVHLSRGSERRSARLSQRVTRTWETSCCFLLGPFMWAGFFLGDIWAEMSGNQEALAATTYILSPFTKLLIIYCIYNKATRLIAI